MSVAETVDYRGYQVEIHYDEDCFNPMKEFDGQPTLVLHEKAEHHFGWTNDQDWGQRLNSALESIRTAKSKEQALGIIQRWLRVFYGVRVLLPVGAGEHSGTWTYVGSGAHWCDPGGWDSGWVGWLFATREQIKEWGFEDRSDDELEESIKASFSEFEAWVGGDCYGYVVSDPDGEQLDDGSCWGFYGSESYDERVESVTVARHLRKGSLVRMHDVVLDVVTDVEDEGDVIRVDWANKGVSVIGKDDPITVIHPGYMREQFQSIVDDEIARRAYRAAEEEAWEHHTKFGLYRRLVEVKR